VDIVGDVFAVDRRNAAQDARLQAFGTLVSRKSAIGLVEVGSQARENIVDCAGSDLVTE